LIYYLTKKDGTFFGTPNTIEAGYGEGASGQGGGAVCGEEGEIFRCKVMNSSATEGGGIFAGLRYRFIITMRGNGCRTCLGCHGRKMLSANRVCGGMRLIWVHIQPFRNRREFFGLLECWNVGLLDGN